MQCIRLIAQAPTCLLIDLVDVHLSSVDVKHPVSKVIRCDGGWPEDPENETCVSCLGPPRHTRIAVHML